VGHGGIGVGFSSDDYGDSQVDATSVYRPADFGDGRKPCPSVRYAVFTSGSALAAAGEVGRAAATAGMKRDNSTRA